MEDLKPGTICVNLHNGESVRVDFQLDTNHYRVHDFITHNSYIVEGNMLVEAELINQENE